MPEFLDRKLKAEYGANNPVVYAIQNKLGLMRGNKITPKGRALQAKHDRDARAGRAGKLAALRGRMR